MHAWNGSVWTLPYELLCYIVIGLLLSFPYYRVRRIGVPGAFALFTFAAVAVSVIDVPSPLRFAAQLLAAFFAGALLRLFADRTPLNGRLAICAATVMLGTLSFGEFRALAPLPLAYVMLYLAARLPFAEVARTNDYSYGVYIYAFPVQQILVCFEMQRFGLPWFIVMSFALVAPFAYASWFFVERPALTWARRRPKRRSFRVKQAV